MARSRGALVLVLAVSGLRTVEADPCPARATLAGDGEAIARVREELVRLGVAIGEPAPGCRAVHAQVELDREGGIAVAIVDGSRRSEGRVVGDAIVAAAWIDSWLRDDVDGLAPAPEVRRAAVRPVARAGGDAATSPARPALERFAIGAGYEHVWMDDDSTADGVGARACLRVGPACLGLAARHVRDGDRAVDVTAMRRRDTALLAVASLPLQVGRMSIAPEVAAGVGRRTTRRIEGCSPPDPGCDKTDPSCNPTPPTCGDANTGLAKIYVGDGLTVATYTPRVEAALRIALPLFEHVWLEGLASVSIAPFGHSDPFAPGTGGTSPPAGKEYNLPGEPWQALQLGVGLRMGSP